MLLFQVRFGTFLVGPVTLFFSHHFILSINVKFLVSCTGKSYFTVFDDAFLQGLTKRSDRFETISLYLPWAADKHTDMTIENRKRKTRFNAWRYISRHRSRCRSHAVQTMVLVVHNSFQIHWFLNYLFGFSIIVRKNHMVASCKQAFTSDKT